MRNLKTNDHKPILWVITGSTAVGKTAVSIEIAKVLNTEIVSADSRQFYKELQIGTAAPTQAELSQVKHHLVGHLSIHDTYNVSDFEQHALEAIDRIFHKNQSCVVSGGSGLYLDAIWRGFDTLPPACESTRAHIENVFAEQGIAGLRLWLKNIDPDFYTRIDLANPNRLKRAIEVTLTTGVPFSQLRTQMVRQRPFQVRFIVLERERDDLFGRINRRVDLMVQQGLIEESIHFFRYKHLNALNTVGYKELFGWISGRCTLHQAIDNIKTHTRRFAKRQVTWFNKYPDAIRIHPDSALDYISRLYKAP